MRTILIDGFDQVSIEGKYDYVDETPQLKNGSKFYVKFEEILCSCDIQSLKSIYLLQKDQNEFGIPTCAMDRCLEVALSVMKDGENAKIYIHLTKDYIDKEIVSDIDFFCSAKLEITENGKDVNEYDSSQKLNFAHRCKEKASKLLQDSKSLKDNSLYGVQLSAFFLLGRAVKWLTIICPNNLSNDTKDEILKLKLLCLNNIAYLHLKFGNHELTISATTYVILEEELNVKALYRRAIANTFLQNYEIATVDLQNALKCEPHNTAIHKQLQIVAEKQKIIDDKYAIAMKKFLNT